MPHMSELVLHRPPDFCRRVLIRVEQGRMSLKAPQPFVLSAVSFPVPRSQQEVQLGAIASPIKTLLEVLRLAAL